jgi:hypothetical protein
MFVQMVKGKVRDREAIQRANDRWRDDVRPGAIGFLGSTAGLAEDGTFIVVARFEDAAAAQANSERPEQAAWFEDAAKAFDGEPTFRDSEDTSLLFDGGSDGAGFVQVMEGRATDRTKVEAMETPEMLDQLHSARPDLLGGVRAWFDDGAFVEVAYFTSEDDARKGEAGEQFSGPQEEFESAFGEVTYTDLKEPMLFGP